MSNPAQKNALVTGAGKRLGRHIALALAARGWNVAVHYGTSATEADAGETDPESRTLREAVDSAVRDRVRLLVENIKSETKIVADDYFRAVTDAYALDTVTTLILRNEAAPTFATLRKINRLDLSLEQTVLDWADDLPITADVLSQARGRCIPAPQASV